MFDLKLIGLIHKKETLRVKTGIDEALHAKKLIIGNHKQLETNGNKLYLTKTDRLTHAYVHWLADVHLAVFAPAFAFVAVRQRTLTQTAKCP